MKFKLIKGNGEGAKEGDIITSDKPLSRMFPDKFQAVEDIQPVPPRASAQPNPTLVTNDDNDPDDDESGDETKDIPQTRKSVATKSTSPHRAATAATRPVRR